ncbi:hypothetical protein OO013_18700 [Mangrovivirga sp. M17]|uniref:Damage-inducible protein DinB n=1 Tax=Mangrovivirga halotolerans TaxID=2993936 RepID=A0ABT3RWH6_9BACT|nr:DinB family protein [Mangrovivirga halotolerans]MCX2745917.1 hypothetical protein [Mangrovivirga halotolerans]
MEKLLEFNFELNNTFCDFTVQNLSYNDKIKRLLSHIINAQDIWISRIKNEMSSLEIWEEHSPEDLKKYNELHLEKFKEIISSRNYDETISYNSLSGKPYTTSIEDILTHVAFHGTHHRAQVAQILSENGIKPPASDYIYYIRKAKTT